MRWVGRGLVGGCGRVVEGGEVAEVVGEGGEMEGGGGVEKGGGVWLG